MPLYEYQCKICGKRFELRRGMSEAAVLTKCPDCGAKDTERVFSNISLRSATVDGVPPSPSCSSSS